MYYRDPDGNQLETQVDNFDTAADAMAFMTGPEFAKNPLGVDFDPEDLCRAVENGEDEQALKKRKDIGPRNRGDTGSPRKGSRSPGRCLMPFTMVRRSSRPSFG